MLKFCSTANKIVFVAILLIAIFLRLSFLSKSPIFYDEPFYSVRSIGLIDTLMTGSQQTPMDLSPEYKWWMSLSFHDHPPLTFLINHFFIKLFNSSLFVTRLPSALFGIASVILVFLIGRRIFNEKVGLIAMGLLAVNDLILVYSRSSMMESIALFFILLALYFFLLALNKPKWLILFGISLGLSFLAKYTAFAMIPVYLTIIIFYRRQYFKNIYFYLAILLSLVVFSPVIIYNIQYYRSFGHFDVQFATLLRQKAPEWKVLVGKEQRGDVGERATGVKFFTYHLSPFFVSISFAGLALLIIGVKDEKKWLAPLGLFSFLLFILVAGTHSRFLFYVVPFMCLLSARFASGDGIMIKEMAKNIFVFILIVYEFAFSLNSLFAPLRRQSMGFKYLAYTPSFVTGPAASEQLDEYFKNELAGKKPTIKYNLRPAIAQKIESMPASVNQFGEDYSTIIFFDNRMAFQSSYWAINRRALYEGWGIMPAYNRDSLKTANQFISLPKYKNTVIYYVAFTDSSEKTRKGGKVEESHAELLNVLQHNLDKKNISSTVIYDFVGQEKYRAYKTDIFTWQKIVSSSMQSLPI